jgi:hypothetical protein
MLVHGCCACSVLDAVESIRTQPLQKIQSTATKFFQLPHPVPASIRTVYPLPTEIEETPLEVVVVASAIPTGIGTREPKKEEKTLHLLLLPYLHSKEMIYDQSTTAF